VGVIFALEAGCRVLVEQLGRLEREVLVLIGFFRLLIRHQMRK
jgi:hypothetical protein